MSMPRQHRGRAGFSLPELLVVMMIAAVLISIVVPRFRQHLERRAVVNARDTFTMMAARARATSIERGENVTLVVDPDQNQVRIETAAGDTIDIMDLADGDIRASMDGTASTEIEFTPRGFADPGSTAGTQVVQFTNGSATARAQISPIGRVDRP